MQVTAGGPVRQSSPKATAQMQAAIAGESGNVGRVIDRSIADAVNGAGPRCPGAEAHGRERGRIAG